jgi:hypothetical protein
LWQVLFLFWFFVCGVFVGGDWFGWLHFLLSDSWLWEEGMLVFG